MATVSPAKPSSLTAPLSGACSPPVHRLVPVTLCGHLPPAAITPLKPASKLVHGL